MHTLISVAELERLLAEGADVRVLDCRYDLARPAAGAEAFTAAHIPGACHADLARDLSGPAGPDRGGRHPLPTATAWRECLDRWRVGPATCVVAYDDSGGCFAARAWWLFHYFGHGNALVLDGGWQAWCAAGGASLSGPADSAPAAPPTTAPGVAAAAAAPAPATAATGAIVSRSELPGKLLVDARDPGHYAGEMEPIDARAGHIPGAHNRFWRLNLDAEGRFLPPGELRSAWLALLGDTRPEEVVCYCGSGVTACHNLLALAHAGIDGARLYPGSWSEYSADPARPVATGLEPGAPLQAG